MNLYLNNFLRYAAHRNLIALLSEDGIRLHVNLMEPYWNTTNYRATLGHKVNHSFVNIKSVFKSASHPRFGPIRSVTAIEDIYKGKQTFLTVIR